MALHGHRRALPDAPVPASLDEEWKAQGGKFNPLNDKMRDDLTAYIKAQTGGRQDLIDKLIPDYAPFSRRPVVDNGWYQALTRDNVELVTDPIARLTPKGIETADGTVREVDVDRHRHRLRGDQVPVARRLHRQGRRWTSTTSGPRTAPAPTSA